MEKIELKDNLDKGMRNILIILGAFCLVSLFSAIKFFQMEQVAQRRYLKVKSENVELNRKIASLSEERTELAKELKTVSKEREEISREREELGEKYVSLVNESKELSIEAEMLAQEKEKLERKISEMESQGFLARLLKKKVSLGVRVKNLEEKLKETRAWEQELEAATKARLELEEQLAEEKEVSQYLSEDFLKEKQERLNALSKLQEAEEGLAGLREKLEISENERERLAVQIANMEGTIKKRLAEVSRTEEAVELPPIIIKAEGSSEEVSPQVIPGGGLEGKIVTVNEEHNFVVIDLGSDDGLEMGMLFGVYRNKKEIAKIKVVGVRKQISAADIVGPGRRAEIKPGDIIRSR